MYGSWNMIKGFTMKSKQGKNVAGPLGHQEPNKMGFTVSTACLCSFLFVRGNRARNIAMKNF